MICRHHLVQSTPHVQHSRSHTSCDDDDVINIPPPFHPSRREMERENSMSDNSMPESCVCVCARSQTNT